MTVRNPARRLMICAVGLAVLVTIPAVEIALRGSLGESHGRVVINEILYNAPNDVEKLEFVELYNASDKPVDLSGWAFLRGIRYEFPDGSVLGPDSYLVICRDLGVFREHYQFEAFGQFSRLLSDDGERIQLADQRGRRIDSVRYDDRHPWPVSPDGYSASLERISPFSSGERRDNWAPSLLSGDNTVAAGSPGQKNSCFSSTLLPTVFSLSFTPRHPKSAQPIRVEAAVTATRELAQVDLLYRTAVPGSETEEKQVLMKKESGTRFTATIPGQDAGCLVRFRIKVVNNAGAHRFYPPENDIRPALSAFVISEIDIGQIPLGFIINVGEKEHEAAQQQRTQDRARGPGRGFFRFPFGRQAPKQPLPAQGRSAFVYVDPTTKKVQLFDFINVTSRKGGYKVRFHKDQMLRGMRTVNLVFEGNERFLLAEAIAYELYRRVGNASLITDFVRLSIDGELVGYHLSFEQPNKSFLRRNKINNKGNLYKIIWMGRGVVEQHEKKTNVSSGHDDLVALVEALDSTEGDEQWEVIKKNFNVDQVVNYFAVNMVLSHWDGFFNNYFTYHDVEGTGKWEIYPWDQDKTQGYYDGVRDSEVFYDMPLTFGMEGDVRPGGSNRGNAGRPGFGPFGGDRPPQRGDRGNAGLPGFGEFDSNTPPGEGDRENAGRPGFGPFGGDRPPRRGDRGNAGPSRFGGFGGFGGGARWWRAGGYFSRPLLANPHFRKRFLKRVKEISQTIYVEKEFFPIIDGIRERLADEVEIRATAGNQDTQQAMERFDRSIQSLREHLTKRREFILVQKEIQMIGS